MATLEMRPTFECVEQHLRMMVKIRKGTIPQGCHWSCIEQVILEFGRRYIEQPLPAKYSRGTPKLCWDNSGRLAMRSKRLVYVEGYAVIENCGFPLHHGWCVNRGSDKAIDVTSENLCCYLGIPFKTEYVRERRKSGAQSMLDDWENCFPMMRMTADEIRSVLET